WAPRRPPGGAAARACAARDAGRVGAGSRAVLLLVPRRCARPGQFFVSGFALSGLASFSALPFSALSLFDFSSLFAFLDSSFSPFGPVAECSVVVVEP